MLLCEGLRVLSLVWRAPFRCGYRRALRLYLLPARAHALLLLRELCALPAQPALFSLRRGALARDEPLPFSQLGGGPGGARRGTARPHGAVLRATTPRPAVARAARCAAR